MNIRHTGLAVVAALSAALVVTAAPAATAAPIAPKPLPRAQHCAPYTPLGKTGVSARTCSVVVRNGIQVASVVQSIDLVNSSKTAATVTATRTTVRANKTTAAAPATVVSSKVKMPSGVVSRVPAARSVLPIPVVKY